MNLFDIPPVTTKTKRRNTPEELDAWCEKIAPDVSQLLESVAGDAAKLAAHLTPAGTVNLFRLLMAGSAAEQKAWRDTREAHYTLVLLLEVWRAGWRDATMGAGKVPKWLEPRGGDVYLWQSPELIDREGVRCFGRRTDLHRSARFDRIEVDVAAIANAHAAGAGFAPQGPTGIVARGYGDGIVQPGHPCRRGTIPELPGFELGKPTATPADLTKASRRSAAGNTW